jgi:alkanesulfonate monooxygenase SsuD/methylene tetrahydromethanopterin reductase-like flavin-dependent oxidoreductase (luciferase family)
MRYGFVVPTIDVLTGPALAEAAENAGWDGVFIPDCLAIDVPGQPPYPASDPWVTLAAMAMRTSRVKLGPMIAAVPRRRPWKLAREVASLDLLSNGRMILPAGIGAAGDDAGFRETGEPMDARTRAELLDETLEIVDGLWTGEPLSYAGKHYNIGSMTHVPTPLQRPRVPIWVVGVWPVMRSVRRSLRWDGIVLQKQGGMLSPEDVAAIHALAESERPAGSSFAIPIEGATPADDAVAARAQVAPWIEAGATWWLEAKWDGTPEDVVRRIEAGPPK